LTPKTIRSKHRILCSCSR